MHDGCFRGDSARTQIVAIGETAGNDDGINVFEIFVVVPKFDDGSAR